MAIGTFPRSATGQKTTAESANRENAPEERSRFRRDRCLWQASIVSNVDLRRTRQSLVGPQGNQSPATSATTTLELDNARVRVVRIA